MVQKTRSAIYYHKYVIIFFHKNSSYFLSFSVPENINAEFQDDHFSGLDVKDHKKKNI